jgi:hypothetical protein
LVTIVLFHSVIPGVGVGFALNIDELHPLDRKKGQSFPGIWKKGGF